MPLYPAQLFRLDQWVRLLHLAGAIVAVGAVVATDALLLVLHARPRIGHGVAKLAGVLSILVWLGFMVLAITGTLLFLPRAWLAADRAFQLKMLLVALVFVNGIVLNVWVTPRFQALIGEWERRTPAVKALERMAAPATVVSMVGWWAIVVISYLISRA